ncbi:NHLP leader peptide family RiPP precursor [Tenacibaculum sp. MEBiC06402]|uniref:NHLP leader peptide family RiPP precursor n=1 Tax=unclassified Tenacibaculum TaxID=2635139 RepID=UPI003B9B8B43
MESTKENQLFNTIIKKAWEDTNFKNELIQNPVEAIEKLTGKKLDLTGGKKVVVNDQTDTSNVYINIPAKPNMEDLQLSEEQLEAVAGGTIVDDIIDVIKDILTPTLPTL